MVEDGDVATIDPAAPGPASGQRGTLFNPHTYDAAEFDPATRRILLATIEFFEERGKVALKEADHERAWYADFLEFCRRERVFATLLTPEAEAAGDPDKRWDTARICAFNEIAGFYGLVYWYTWQVSILGLGPLLTTAPPDESQQGDLGFLLTIGELFTLVVYGQLILEQAELTGLDRDIVDQLFDVFVRDFSSQAVTLHGQASAESPGRDGPCIE